VTPFLLVLSAPSGGGKTTIARALLEARDDVEFSVSATTRQPRPSEVEGRDYRFISRETFQQAVQAGEFLEWAEYSGQLYGTLEAEIRRILQAGRHAVLDIEIHGARRVRERAANVVSIFILPPSIETLTQRLRQRSTEKPGQMAARLRRAVEEIGEAAEYDYIVINEDRTQAVADVARILDAEAHRPSRLSGIEELLNDLRDGLTQEAKAAAQRGE
jgi:guanylate kinase